MHVDQLWRTSPQASDVHRQHPFVRIGSRMICVGDPFQIHANLEARFGELMEGDVRGVGRGVDQSQALEISPIGLLQPLVSVLWEFYASALDRRGDRVRWRV